MPTNENALREQGENMSSYIKSNLNFTIKRGLVSYENLRQTWIAVHLDYTEIELIEACLSMGKVCGLNVTRTLQCLSGFHHEYL